jgi:hypothetical protein
MVLLAGRCARNKKEQSLIGANMSVIVLNPVGYKGLSLPDEAWRPAHQSLTWVKRVHRCG